MNQDATTCAALEAARLEITLYRYARNPAHGINPGTVEEFAKALIENNDIEFATTGQIRPKQRQSWEAFFFALRHRPDPYHWAFVEAEPKLKPDDRARFLALEHAFHAVALTSACDIARSAEITPAEAVQHLRKGAEASLTAGADMPGEVRIYLKRLFDRVEAGAGGVSVPESLAA